MNKKFSTLLVGALLASSMSVVAQTATPGKFAPNLPLEDSGKYLYQLRVAPGTAPIDVYGTGGDHANMSVLVVDKDGDLFLVDSVDYEAGAFAATYKETLWCIGLDTEAGGKNPTYSFTNKAHDFILSAAVEDANIVAKTTPDDELNIKFTSLSDWKFSARYEEEGSLEQGQYLATYFKPDSVLVLTKGITGDATKVGVKKFRANDPDIALDATVLRFYPFIPGSHYVTAEEYNTLFHSVKEGFQSLQFTKDKTLLTNPFSDTSNKLKASAAKAPYNNYWLNFTLDKADGQERWLRVDTAHANSDGVKFLTFAYGKTLPNTPTGSLVKADSLYGHYDFLLEYFVHNDSIAIDVRRARYNLENQPKDSWHLAYPTDWYEAANAPTRPYAGRDSLHLKLQDLVTSQNLRIITIGTTPVNTKAYFGIGGCTGSIVATSVADNLYTIKNTRGQYLVVPIYTDSVNINSTNSRDNLYPQWLTLDNLTDPNKIPAYQWIVEKTRKNDVNNTSPIRIVNREFGDIQLNTVQLTTEADGVELGYGYLKADGFVAVPDEDKANPYLGYKFVAEDESTVFTYVFNYLNTFAPEDASLYLGVNSTASDSLMYVGGKTNFQIIPMASEPTKYGAMPSYTTKGSNFEKIAQLVRHSYMLKIKDSNKLTKSNKVLVVDQEKRYAITDTSHLKVTKVPVGGEKWRRYNGIDTAIFYLKTNNTKDGIDYYALMDTNSFTPNWTDGGVLSTTYLNSNGKLWTVKAGVSETNKFVRAQNQSEERTSTFAIDIDPDPLYRRFNSELEGQANSDVPDTVKFFRMNNSADQLYEDAYSNYSKPVNPNAPKDQINFLGVQNKAQFPNANYAIYVDTAFVARPATKDSKIDTPKPQYMLVMGPEVVPPGTYCPVHGIGATCGHQVDTEGFVYGRYLINATDSAKNDFTTNDIRDERYIWQNQWERLVFVNAIHKGDTLYLLNDGFDIKEGQLITNEALQKISYTWFDLGNNLHKDVVFSFRLIDSEPTKNFLIESETTLRDTDNGLMIAPMEGGWVKVHNGVPVISRGAYGDKAVDAEIWNVVKTTEAPLANDEITVGDDVFNVVAGVGTVTVKNAAGSKVTISNILGQTIASVALTNDNQTISVPAGIVVVAVEGQAAVKAIVK